MRRVKTWPCGFPGSTGRSGSTGPASSLAAVGWGPAWGCRLRAHRIPLSHPPRGPLSPPFTYILGDRFHPFTLPRAPRLAAPALKCLPSTASLTRYRWQSTLNIFVFSVLRNPVSLDMTCMRLWDRILLGRRKSRQEEEVHESIVPLVPMAHESIVPLAPMAHESIVPLAPMASLCADACVHACASSGHPNEPEEGKASQGTGQVQRLRGLLE